MIITATKLYNYIQCPHRVWRDIYGPQDEKRDEDNLFLQMLWERGVLHEKNIVDKLGSFKNVTEGTLDERFCATTQAMDAGVELIYQGVIKHGNLLGIPDLLKRVDAGCYIPIDIKSGRGYGDFSDESKEKYKKHYAVQLCLYVDILQGLGCAQENKGIIIDGQGEYVDYALDNAMGVRTSKTHWELYEEIKQYVAELISNQKQNVPALGSVCKQCVWYESCKKWCYAQDDISKLFYLGRSLRDALNTVFNLQTTRDISDASLEDLMAIRTREKERLKGTKLGEKTLTSIYKRAQVLNVRKLPVAYEKISFPEVETELYLDIEDDPMQGIVYLHGIWEKQGDKTRFVSFVAASNDTAGEKEAFRKLWKYLKSFEGKSHAIYYYSNHEKSTYKGLSEEYPDVVTPGEVDAYFEKKHVIDLYYDVILSKTDWPLPSYSLKAIATYIGFTWRDENPSGATSIQWYFDYCQTQKKTILDRILKYNEDDCVASMVIKEYLTKMPKESVLI
ncbi:MAG: TM0106 family RecB-like putative nuclease [Candidatus Omnitrophica bacterium]|nr:TM0106 family RecB-like putative nuclease [bacterium]MBU1864447.1 TM0106 family RecB-like putative nuclease [Candidatus Omnitrophota bacterium]